MTKILSFLFSIILMISFTQCDTKAVESASETQEQNESSDALTVLPTKLDTDTMTVSVNGQKIFCRTIGSGTPVLLWHGFLGSSYSWRKFWPLLAEDYAVIIPDMRGYGHSTKPGEGYDAMMLADDFKMLMQKLGHERYHVIVHDMGGPAALYLAHKNPELIITLTYLEEPLLNSEFLNTAMQYSPDSKIGGLWWWPMGLGNRVPSTILPGNEVKFFSWFVQNYQVNPPTDVPLGERDYVRTFMGEEGIRGAFGVYREVFTTASQMDSIPENSLQMPILALGGAGSIGESVGNQISTIGSNVTTGVVEDCGHFIPEERPAELYERWSEFIQ